MGVEAAIVASVVGAGIQAIGQLDQAKQEKKASRRRATEMRQAASVENERGRRLRAAQRASFGAAGVGMSGTPILRSSQSFLDSLLDQEAILQGARNIEEEGRLRARAATIGAIGSLVGGASQVISQTRS